MRESVLPQQIGTIKQQTDIRIIRQRHQFAVERKILENRWHVVFCIVSDIGLEVDHVSSNVGNFNNVAFVDVGGTRMPLQPHHVLGLPLCQFFAIRQRPYDDSGLPGKFGNHFGAKLGGGVPIIQARKCDGDWSALAVAQPSAAAVAANQAQRQQNRNQPVEPTCAEMSMAHFHACTDTRGCPPL